MMKSFKFIMAIAAVAISVPFVDAQIQIDVDAPVKFSGKDRVAVLQNNNKVLTKQGRDAIEIADMANATVRRDTIYIKLKPDAFKRLEKDPANFKETSDNKKKK